MSDFCHCANPEPKPAKHFADMMVCDHCGLFYDAARHKNDPRVQKAYRELHDAVDRIMAAGRNSIA